MPTGFYFCSVMCMILSVSLDTNCLEDSASQYRAHAVKCPARRRQLAQVDCFRVPYCDIQLAILLRLHNGSVVGNGRWTPSSRWAFAQEHKNIVGLFEARVTGDASSNMRLDEYQLLRI